MSYTALYRKWRPATFEDVKGQDAIVRTLKNQIESGRIGHAYLFCGTRGTGKTSVAKIFARAVNCEHPVNGSPCGECAACRAIQDGVSLNVVEMDAASNNGVDNIRTIISEIGHSPVQGKYKVYIIDEVHMLSTGAFNALLKTLEEPPSYVIFILATTEANKIPITVLSRCQRYDFRRIQTDTIYDRLKEMTDSEGIEAEEKALRFIARKGEGSLRDAISVLDQCVAFYYGQKLTYANVLEVCGAVDQEIYSQLFRNCLARDTVMALKQIEEMAAQGRDPGQFVSDFIWYMRSLLLLKASEGEEDALEMTAEDIAALKEEAQIVEIPVLMRFIRIFSDLAGSMRSSTNKRVLLEMAVIRLAIPEMDQDTESLTQRVERLESAMESGNFAPAGARDEAAGMQSVMSGFDPAAGSAGSADSTADSAAAGQNGQKKAQVVALERGAYEDYQTIQGNWKYILRDAGGIIPAALRECRLSWVEDGVIRIWCTTHPTYMIGSRPSVLDRLSEVVAEKYGIKMTFQAGERSAAEDEETIYVSRDEVAAHIHMEIETED